MEEIKRLWAPWRYEYVKKAHKKMKGCFLCNAVESKSPKDSLLIYKGNSSIIVLNRYPYNPGHLLIAPTRHVAEFEDLNKEELCELIETIVMAKKVLDEVYNPNGYNIGVNLGRAAGAGLEDHLHIHIVPRWFGDTSFTVTLSGVKVIVEALEQSYEELRKAFQKLKA